MCTVWGLGIRVYSALSAPRVENAAGRATTPAIRSATEVLALPSTVLVRVERRRCGAEGALIVLAAVVVSLGVGVRKKSRRYAVARRYPISPSYFSDAQD